MCACTTASNQESVKAVTRLSVQLREPRSLALLRLVATGKRRSATLAIEQHYPADATTHCAQTGRHATADHHGNINSALHAALPKSLAT
jgi:hypothetical protein